MRGSFSNSAVYLVNIFKSKFSDCLQKFKFQMCSQRLMSFHCNFTRYMKYVVLICGQCFVICSVIAVCDLFYISVIVFSSVWLIVVQTLNKCN